MAALCCDVCDRDGSDTVIIARWHDVNVCTDCLDHKAEMDRDEAASGCVCLDCLRYRHLHFGA
jgi:hypothetical protein